MMARRFESRAKAPELEYRSPPPRYKHQQLELELECARVFNSVQTCQPEYGMYYYTFVEFSSSQPEYDDRPSPHPVTSNSSRAGDSRRSKLVIDTCSTHVGQWFPIGCIDGANAAGMKSCVDPCAKTRTVRASAGRCANMCSSPHAWRARALARCGASP